MIKEKHFVYIAKSYLKNCRPGDWEHSKRVAKWVKKLAENRRDIKILIISAYLHDIGWYKILPQNKTKITFEQLKKYEPKANKNSEKMVRKILKEFDITERQIKRILGLIKAVDKHRSQTRDEEILVDSDSLSKLNINHLEQKYHREDWDKVYTLWEKSFPKRIKTKQAKEIYPKLLKKLKGSIQKMPK